METDRGTVVIQTKNHGERSAIGPFYLDSRSDIDQLLTMYCDPENRKWLVNPPSTEEEIIELLTHPGEKSKIYAVRGSLNHVGIDETGLVQGRIYLYPLEQETAQCMRQAKLIGPENQSTLDIEVGYMSMPHAKQGQMASGLRQAMMDYKQYYDQPMNVYACTDQANIKSERVLIASGFDMIGTAAYSAQYPDSYNFWQLDWNKLYKIKLEKISNVL